MTPWSVVWVNLDPQVGHEQAGRRPAIVVSTALGSRINFRMGLAMVVPTTTRQRDWPWRVPVLLKEPSFAQCEQLRAISLRRLAGPYTPRPTVSEAERDAIRRVLRSLVDV